MQLADVNVLLYAHLSESEHHQICRDWLEATVNGDEAFGLSDLVASAVIRIATNRRIFDAPSQIADAIDFIEGIRVRPNCLVVAPAERHWAIFTNLCRELNIRGGRVTDAYFAALAIESGSEWITLDGDFARFPGLRWRRPTS